MAPQCGERPAQPRSRRSPASLGPCRTGSCPPAYAPQCADRPDTATELIVIEAPERHYAHTTTAVLHGYSLASNGAGCPATWTSLRPTFGHHAASCLMWLTLPTTTLSPTVPCPRRFGFFALTVLSAAARRRSVGRSCRTGARPRRSRSYRARCAVLRAAVPPRSSAARSRGDAGPGVRDGYRVARRRPRPRSAARLENVPHVFAVDFVHGAVKRPRLALRFLVEPVQFVDVAHGPPGGEGAVRRSGCGTPPGQRR